MFRRNVGGIDRVLRVTLGPILIIAGLSLLTGRTGLGVTLAVVGCLALLTGVVRFCVLYIPFGISTTRPGAQSCKPTCDCERWVKEMEPPRSVAKKPVASEQEGRGAMPAAQGR